MTDPRIDLHRRVVETAPFGVLFFAYGVCVEVNPAALELLGCERDQVLGHDLETLAPEDSVALASLTERIRDALSEGAPQVSWELRAADDRRRFLVQLGVGAGQRSGELVVAIYPQFGAEAAESGAADPRRAPSRSSVLRKLGGAVERRRGVYRDELTRLPTRQAMLDHLRATWSGPGAAAGCAALMLIDLDHFKDINDSWGHELGDRVLARVAQSLHRQMSAAGAPAGAFLARLAGDEFALFVPGLGETLTEAAVRARALAEVLRELVATPIFLDGAEFALTASVGISLLNDATLEPERALQYADTAMYEAKRKGRNGCAFFDRAIAAKAQRQVALNTRLRKAVDNQEFVLYVQPIMTVAHDHLIGGEVLLRWINSDRVTSMPAEFIPLLEKSGLIVDVGHWVIRTACEHLRGFLDAGVWRADMQLHINVSRRQFQDQRLLEVIEHSLRSYDIDPGLLAFEITETLAMEDVEAAVAKMHAVKAMGGRFAVDDFGVGYSSMSALRRLPFDWLKIDREFIRNVHRDPDARGIVEAILGVSRQYGLKVTAEGVEDAAALELLRQIGCDSYQGALYSMPVPVERFGALLAATAAA
ncbi:MAG: putative bifunctional diguanylate cyclase/phosphodiesterase [Pseudomonadota bacterium]